MENVYPSWRYHRTNEPRIVGCEAEDKALGAEWADTPAKFQDLKEEGLGHGGPEIKEQKRRGKR